MRRCKITYGALTTLSTRDVANEEGGLGVLFGRTITNITYLPLDDDNDEELTGSFADLSLDSEDGIQGLTVDPPDKL